MGGGNASEALKATLLFGRRRLFRYADLVAGALSEVDSLQKELVHERLGQVSLHLRAWKQGPPACRVLSVSMMQNLTAAVSWGDSLFRKIATAKVYREEMLRLRQTAVNAGFVSGDPLEPLSLRDSKKDKSSSPQTSPPSPPSPDVPSQGSASPRQKKETALSFPFAEEASRFASSPSEQRRRLLTSQEASPSAGAVVLRAAPVVNVVRFIENQEPFPGECLMAPSVCPLDAPSSRPLLLPNRRRHPSPSVHSFVLSPTGEALCCGADENPSLDGGYEADDSQNNAGPVAVAVAASPSAFPGEAQESRSGEPRLDLGELKEEAPYSASSAAPFKDGSLAGPVRDSAEKDVPRRRPAPRLFRAGPGFDLASSDTSSRQRDSTQPKLAASLEEVSSSPPDDCHSVDLS